MPSEATLASWKFFTLSFENYDAHPGMLYEIRQIADEQMRTRIENKFHSITHYNTLVDYINDTSGRAYPLPEIRETSSSLEPKNLKKKPIERKNILSNASLAKSWDRKLTKIIKTIETNKLYKSLTDEQKSELIESIMQETGKRVLGWGVDTGSYTEIMHGLSKEETFMETFNTLQENRIKPEQLNQNWWNIEAAKESKYLADFLIKAYGAAREAQRTK